MLAGGLQVSVVADAGGSTRLALGLAVLAQVVLGVGLMAGRPACAQGEMALLLLLFCLRRGDRLALAAVYGAASLMVEELTHRAIELRAIKLGTGPVFGVRLAAILTVAALGGLGGAVATTAVNAAPGRSLAFTVAGAFAAVAALAAVVRLALTANKGEADER